MAVFSLHAHLAASPESVRAVRVVSAWRPARNPGLQARAEREA